jgi:serine/threonine-protein kinase
VSVIRRESTRTVPAGTRAGRGHALAPVAAVVHHPSVKRVPERLAAPLADRYRIERELGAGGMATVYLAHDLRHDRPVAIKVLHDDLGATLGAERFLAEIRMTARLQHPHILPLLDSGAVDVTDEGPAERPVADGGQRSQLLYYVMPYVAGETLRGRLERNGPLTCGEALPRPRERVLRGRSDGRAHNRSVEGQRAAGDRAVERAGPQGRRP